jgi:hypothetical protein
MTAPPLPSYYSYDEAEKLLGRNREQAMTKVIFSRPPFK